MDFCQLFLYIQDIMVVPEYQGQKVGTKIMNELLKKVDEYKKVNPNIRTYLGASKGKEKFYEKFGNDNVKVVQKSIEKNF